MRQRDLLYALQLSNSSLSNSRNVEDQDLPCRSYGSLFLDHFRPSTAHMRLLLYTAVLLQLRCNTACTDATIHRDTTHKANPKETRNKLLIIFLISNPTRKSIASKRRHFLLTLSHCKDPKNPEPYPSQKLNPNHHTQLQHFTPSGSPTNSILSLQTTSLSKHQKHKCGTFFTTLITLYPNHRLQLYPQCPPYSTSPFFSSTALPASFPCSSLNRSNHTN